MDWYDEANINLKKKREILFSKTSECLAPLMSELDKADRKSVVLWAFYFAEQAVGTLAESYPDESAPADALALTRLWALGKIKMPEAKRAILACHALAKRISSPRDIALCHAVGQALGSVHAKGHAIGFAIYELTSLIREYGVEGCSDLIPARLREYSSVLKNLTAPAAKDKCEWADFFAD